MTRILSGNDAHGHPWSAADSGRWCAARGPVSLAAGQRGEHVGEDGVGPGGQFVVGQQLDRMGGVDHAGAIEHNTEPSTPEPARPLGLPERAANGERSGDWPVTRQTGTASAGQGPSDVSERSDPLHGARWDLDLLTPDDVCALLKVKKSWLYDTVEAGAIEVIRLGKQLRFRPSALIRYLEDRAISADVTRRPP